MKNLMGKSRKEDNPYLVFQNDAGWTWKVLKSWQADNGKPYGRWFCAVSSPMTYGESELGDVYVAEVMRYGRLVDYDHDIEGLLEQASTGINAPEPEVPR